MLLDFGKLIHDQVPDKSGQFLPPDLTTGAYRILDLTDHAAGGLYEGKVIVDKTYGHAAYGCAICCGPNNPYMLYNPLLVPVGGSSGQQIDAINSCSRTSVNITSDFPTWWTDSTSIATASGSQINGIAVGSTNNNAQSIMMYFGPITDSGGVACPLSQVVPIAGTNVGPYRVEPIATPSQFTISCTLQGGATGYGWERNVTNQLQYSNGAPYAHAGLTVADNISIGSRNDLRLGNPQTGSDTTDSNGSWPDTYYDCTTVCPSSTGETDALQNWTANGVPLAHVNTVVFKCGSIKVDTF